MTTCLKATLVESELLAASSILTVSGVNFSLARPLAKDVRLEDIAQGLSLTNRYSGQTRQAYSVAQHAVLVARSLRDAGERPRVQQWGLHHDDAEAYCGDVTRPLKRLMRRGGEWSAYDEIERRIMAAIAEALGLVGTEQPAAVEHHDKAVGAREQIDLGRVPADWVPLVTPATCVVTPWSAAKARRVFMFEHLRIESEVAA